MKGHLEVKFVLRSLLRQWISKFRAIWGKQFEKGTGKRRKCKGKGRNTKERNTQRSRKQRGT
jgi:hypothetical protein